MKSPKIITKYKKFNPKHGPVIEVVGFYKGRWCALCHTRIEEINGSNPYCNNWIFSVLDGRVVCKCPAGTKYIKVKQSNILIKEQFLTPVNI